jgi:hypothetical protein
MDFEPFKEPSKLQIQGSEANLCAQVLIWDAKNIADYTDRGLTWPMAVAQMGDIA